MKRRQLFVLYVVILIFLSFNLVHAAPLAQFTDNNAQLQEQINEKKGLIKQRQKENEKLEKQIEEKGRKLELLMAKLPENSVIDQERIQNQINGKLEVFMKEFMEIGKTEMSVLKHLKRANKQFAANKPNTGLKHLNKALDALEKEHGLLVRFNTTLEEFIEFIESLELK